MQQVSLARLKTWVNASSVERASSRPFGGWGVEAIVQAGGVMKFSDTDAGRAAGVIQQFELKFEV